MVTSAAGERTVISGLDGGQRASQSNVVEAALPRRPGIVAAEANPVAKGVSVHDDPARTTVEDGRHHCRDESVPDGTLPGLRNDECTTTAPFDIFMLNDLDRFHSVIDRVRGPGAAAAHLGIRMVDAGLAARIYTVCMAKTSPRSAAGPGPTRTTSPHPQRISNPASRIRNRAQPSRSN